MCVRRWPSPPSHRRSSQAPAEVLLLPARREVGFRGSPARLARRCSCSCIHYLVPTAPTRGPCEKQTPRGLAEEAGERFLSPCHGCCLLLLQPQGLGNQPLQACRERVPCVVLLSRVAGPGASGSPAHPTPRPPALHRENFQKGNKAFRPVGEMWAYLACGTRKSTMGLLKRKLNDCQCHGPRGSDLHTLWLSLRLKPVFEVFLFSFFVTRCRGECLCFLSLLLCRNE